MKTEPNKNIEIFITNDVINENINIILQLIKPFSPTNQTFTFGSQGNK